MALSAAISRRCAALACAAATALAAGTALAQDTPASARARLLALPEVEQWIASQYTPAEREALGADDIAVSGARCGCSDQPTPHFPYSMVIFSSPRGDLVTRFEGDEAAVRITPLATRNGLQYCSIYQSEGCYGEFATPCDFTDHRFGPALAPYFPDCKG